MFPAKIRGEHPWVEVILTHSKDAVQTDERGLWALLLALGKMGSRRTAGKGAGPGPEMNPFSVSQAPHVPHDLHRCALYLTPGGFWALGQSVKSS